MSADPRYRASVEVLEIDALPRQRGHRFAAGTGFDPRALATAFPVVPHLPATSRSTADRCRDRVDDEEPDVPP